MNAAALDASIFGAGGAAGAPICTSTFSSAAGSGAPTAAIALSAEFRCSSSSHRVDNAFIVPLGWGVPDERFPQLSLFCELVFTSVL